MEVSQVEPIKYPKPGLVEVLDQRLLPEQEIYIDCTSGEQMADAIRDMVLRGAPLIGVAAAMGLSLAFESKTFASKDERRQYFATLSDQLFNTRPTAVNLQWALNRMKALFDSNDNKSDEELGKILHDEAVAIMEEDRAMNRSMGEHGAALFQDGDQVLTHCNAGALATGGYGTALGVLRSVNAAGKKIKVFVDETRPYLQGARLTAWELVKEGIDATLIADNMAGHCMQQGMIKRIIVGADRIAMNGDFANKIGTYSLAVLAKEHGIPLYVAAPSSTVDPDCPSGDKIPIEQRSREELTHLASKQLAPEGVGVYNPAFDVTPASMVAAIITEKGVFKAPFDEPLRNLIRETRG